MHCLLCPQRTVNTDLSAITMALMKATEIFYAAAAGSNFNQRSDVSQA